MPGIRDGRRETVGCDPVTGEPLQILRLPHPTWVPMLSAFGLAILFGATLASAYWVSAAGAVIALTGFTLWVWEPSDSGVVRDAGLGHMLPVNIVDRRSHMHVGIVGTMLVLFALFASLLFGVLYLWNTGPRVAESLTRPLSLPAFCAVALGLGVALAGQATRRAALRDRFAAAGGLAAATALLSALSLAALALALAPVDPWKSALGATLWAVTVFTGVNLFVVFYWALINVVRKLAGRVRPGQAMPDFNLATYAKGTGAMVVVAACFFIAGAMGAVG